MKKKCSKCGEMRNIDYEYPEFDIEKKICSWCRINDKIDKNAKKTTNNN